MYFRSTESALQRDSTLVGYEPTAVRPHAPFPGVLAPRSDEGRFYGRLCQDTMKSGHLDSRNTRLTIPNVEAQTLRHANLNNRNPGDRTRNMGDRAFMDLRHLRGEVDNYGGGGVLGDDMKDFITQLDPTHVVNAIEVEDFQHGGTRADAVRGTMMGAGGSVPMDNLDGTNLNNAYGLHYAIDIKPGNAITSMQKKMESGNIAGMSGASMRKPSMRPKTSGAEGM